MSYHIIGHHLQLVPTDHAKGKPAVHAFLKDLHELV